MAGTRAGGIAAAKKNKAKDPEFYARIGAMGGRKGRTGGFASDKVGEDGLTGRQRAAQAGARGGRISRRTKKQAKA
ncbi:MAG TPA: KGG domain-containing protein [Ktedonobacteraceae bacterium]|nr:KGG domain-containing protein [Ktedonobacteraceae bacterium]